MMLILKAMFQDPIFACLAFGQFVSWLGIAYCAFYCVNKLLEEGE